MKIEFSKRFERQYSKAPKNIQQAFDQRLVLFLESSNHPMLRLHALHGSYQGYSSINITGDWRALFRRLDQTTIFFDMIGTHSQLYR